MYKDSFLNYLQYIKRYSDHTVKSYQIDLTQFISFCQENNVMDEAKADYKLVRLWIVSLMESENSARSVNRKISTLRTYYKYLLKEKIVERSPLQKIIPPKSLKSLPSFIEEKSMNALLDNVSFTDDFEGVRNKLIIEMFYCTGARRFELINLLVKNINFQNSTIKVLGKRNKERIIPFNTELKNLIELYNLKRNELEVIENSEFLFLTKSGKKIYPELIYRVVKSYLSLVTTSEKKSPHVLRHTFATHMLNRGAELNAIKELLGHSNLAATEVYTHNTFEKLKQIYKQAHPRA
ncbi:MAG TPA: integrase [Bacteroidales bacterium]|nr:MAG: integrase [Bacteroidetes bacterium GWF2_33_38]OFY74373.1 MAG: integrase [Bacteroidetes bacterium RIFOXYA12_FULL_33_9]HBF88427.1 integrase [Bacteroidales bacterium]